MLESIESVFYSVFIDERENWTFKTRLRKWTSQSLHGFYKGIKNTNTTNNKNSNRENRLLQRRYTMAIFFLKVENKRQNKLDFLLICEDKVVIRTTFARQHKINMRIKLCYKTTQNLDDNMEYKCGWNSSMGFLLVQVLNRRQLRRRV